VSGAFIPGISVADIDRDRCFFNPGCALSLYRPASGGKILALLNERFGPVLLHELCCRHDPGLPRGSVIINNCAGCDRRFRSLYEGIETISLWEVLDSIPDLPLPDWTGLAVSVHDSCSFRPKPQVHAAVRSLLGKMHITTREAALSGARSVCCGDNLYGQVPNARIAEFQKARAAQMPCGDVAVYCVSCVKSMAVGGKRPHHMVDLVLGDETEPGDLGLDAWHAALARYIEAH
jgi:hypothetical protein